MCVLLMYISVNSVAAVCVRKTIRHISLHFYNFANPTLLLLRFMLM